MLQIGLLISVNVNCNNLKLLDYTTFQRHQIPHNCIFNLAICIDVMSSNQWIILEQRAYLFIIANIFQHWSISRAAQIFQSLPKTKAKYTYAENKRHMCI